MKTANVAILFLIGFLLNSCAPKQRIKGPSFKGMELYSYVDDNGNMKYALLIGTNRNKEVEEIVESSVGYDEVIEEIKGLATEECLTWTVYGPGHLLYKYPDRAVIQEIESTCKELGIDFFRFPNVGGRALELY